MEDFEILAKCAKDVLKSIWSLGNLQESWESSVKLLQKRSMSSGWIDFFQGGLVKEYMKPMQNVQIISRLSLRVDIGVSLWTVGEPLNILILF